MTLELDLEKFHQEVLKHSENNPDLINPRSPMSKQCKYGFIFILFIDFRPHGYLDSDSKIGKIQ